MYSLYYFDSFFCQNIQWLFTRFRNQKNSLDGEVLFSIHYFSLACNEVGEEREREKQHFIPSLTLCVFSDTLSTLNHVTIRCAFRRPAKSRSALVSPFRHTADLVVLVMLQHQCCPESQDGFHIMMIIQPSFKDSPLYITGGILPILWYFLQVKESTKYYLSPLLLFLHTFFFSGSLSIMATVIISSGMLGRFLLVVVLSICIAVLRFLISPVQMHSLYTSYHLLEARMWKSRHQLHIPTGP